MTSDGIRDVLARHVAANSVRGALSVVLERGALHVASAGELIDSRSVVRITSLTKPIVAAAALSLVERGRFGLDDPVERYLPELADRRVLRRFDAPLDDTEPARRSITLRHLLTCTMGFGFPMTPGPHPIMKEQDALGVGLGPPKPAKTHEPDEWLRRFATLPLMAHPGEAWMYDTSFSVLGVLMSRREGASLAAVLRETILGPLGMEDTGFHVPVEKLARFAPCYQASQDGSASAVFDDNNGDSQWAQPPAFPDPAGGLVSTADDFLKFAQMLLAMGEYSGTRRLLTERSIEVMTSNHITTSQRGPASAMFLENRGWGMGVSVALPPDDDWSRPGRYGWEGGLGTSWFNDPRTSVCAILVSQRFPPAFELFTDFWKGVSDATKANEES